MCGAVEISLVLCYFYPMKKHIIYSGIAVLLVISACQTNEQESQSVQANSQEHLLQTVVWYQHSAEMKAAYIQAFNWAGRILKSEAQLGATLPLAVVLDIDETVLDNSPQTARQILDGEAFSNEMWDEWCLLAEAEPLPGALEFTLQAMAMGVEVFYISNRGIHLLDVSLKNLKSAGFPNADAEHVLLKTDSSVKDERRASVRETHDVVLLIGDNLGDFSGIFDERQGGLTSEEVMKNREMFGSEFIILPNPLYGSWEKPFRGESPMQTKQNKTASLRAYQR